MSTNYKNVKPSWWELLPSGEYRVNFRHDGIIQSTIAPEGIVEVVLPDGWRLVMSDRLKFISAWANLKHEFLVAIRWRKK